MSEPKITEVRQKIIDEIKRVAALPRRRAGVG